MPKGGIGNMYCSHFATIFSNMSIVFAAIFLFAALLLVSSPLIMVFGYILLAMILIISLGLLALVPEFMQLFEGGSEMYEQLFTFIKLIAPYAFAVIAALSVLAIVFYAVDRRCSHTGRIVCNSVFLALSVVAFIFIKLFEGAM